MNGPRIISRANNITLEAALNRVFPLFGPIAEMEWAEDWRPQLLHGDPSHVEEHMVFQTQSGHPQDPGQATWIVSKYEQQTALIEYTVFTEARIWWISVKCRPLEGNEATEATIEYTYLGLNERASKINEEAMEGIFRNDLADWQAAINHYLRTGTLLHHDHFEQRGDP
jgi:hypothetical protein